MELAIINGTYRDPSAKLGQPGSGGVSGNVVSGVGVGGSKGAELLSICEYFLIMIIELILFCLSILLDYLYCCCSRYIHFLVCRLEFVHLSKAKLLELY